MTDPVLADSRPDGSHDTLLPTTRGPASYAPRNPTPPAKRVTSSRRPTRVDDAQ